MSWSRAAAGSSGSFLDAGQIDAVEVFVAPILEGGDHARTAVRGPVATLMSDAPATRATSRSTGSATTSVSAAGCRRPGGSATPGSRTE